MEGKEVTFNKLYRIIRDFEFKFSRPTLTDHLNNHLVKSGLVEKRIDQRSKLHLKPCYYSLNKKALSTLFNTVPQASQSLKEFKKIDDSLENQDFKVVAWDLLRLVYLADLITTKLFIKSCVTKNPIDKQELYFSSRLGFVFTDAIKLKLMHLSKKVKEKGIEEVIAEFDNQIDRCTKFFDTGKLD